MSHQTDPESQLRAVQHTDLHELLYKREHLHVYPPCGHITDLPNVGDGTMRLGGKVGDKAAKEAHGKAAMEARNRAANEQRMRILAEETERSRGQGMPCASCYEFGTKTPGCRRCAAQGFNDLVWCRSIDTNKGIFDEETTKRLAREEADSRRRNDCKSMTWA